MCQYSAEDGMPNDWHLVHLGSRAIGGAGLVIAEMTDVSREGRISPGCTGMYKPEHVAAWRRIVDFVHRHTGARIALQLAHAGRKGSTRRMWEGIDEPLPHGNWPLVSASPIPYFPHSQVPREMTRERHGPGPRPVRPAPPAWPTRPASTCSSSTWRTATCSPASSRRSPTSGRTSTAGCSSRMRYPLEVFDAVRAAWPAAQAHLGQDLGDGLGAGRHDGGGRGAGRGAGSGRTGATSSPSRRARRSPDQKPVYGRLYQTPFSDRIRHEAGIPTMTVGNISTYADVNTILAAGRADLCVLARGHLYDPYWTRHAAREQDFDLPWPDQYLSVKSFTPRVR